jgi:flagellin
MSLNSVNTNTGAMIALQSLNSTNAQLQTAQNQINTGLKVATAKDDGATWAIAQNMRSRSSSLDTVMSSLSRGQSTIDVANSAGSQISDLLTQMKQKALAAADTSIDATSRSALNDDFKSLRDQISKVVANADFNGINMIKSGGSSIQSLANADGSSRVTVAAQDLSLGGTNVTVAATASFSSAATASALVATVATSITNVSAALAKLGTGSNALSSYSTFISNLKDTLDAGVGSLVDADLAKESAKLTALQTKQQLGVQALSIANSSTSTILSLFR